MFRVTRQNAGNCLYLHRERQLAPLQIEAPNPEFLHGAIPRGGKPTFFSVTAFGGKCENGETVVGIRTGKLNYFCGLFLVRYLLRFILSGYMITTWNKMEARHPLIYPAELCGDRGNRIGGNNGIIPIIGV